MPGSWTPDAGEPEAETPLNSYALPAKRQAGLSKIQHIGVVAACEQVQLAVSVHAQGEADSRCGLLRLRPWVLSFGDEPG